MLRDLTKTTCWFRFAAALGTAVLVIGLGFCLFHIDEHSLLGHDMSQSFCSGISMGPIAVAPIFALFASGSLDVVQPYNPYTVDRIPFDHPPEFPFAV
jgi:hypothetical protein